MTSNCFWEKRIRFILLFCLIVGYGALPAGAQDNRLLITGTVSSDSALLEGAIVRAKSAPKIIARTNEKGFYSIRAAAGDTLVFSFVGYKPYEVAIQSRTLIEVKLTLEDNGLNDVAVVGYGTQRKISMVSSVTTINPKELKGPTGNLTTMLAGRIAGLIAYQQSGEPGADNASFFIRGLGSFGSGKVDPLILIDGVESSSTDLARLQPDDIASFSVLKDATAAAVYGARGANGVVLVITKRGESGKTKFGFRAENSISTNTRNFGFSDNITYMKLANEAVLTRTPEQLLPYSQNKIDHTEAGDNPLLYPSNNWIQQLIKDYTANQRFNLNVSGGAPNAQYYLSGTYNVDNGLLKGNELNSFSNNIKLRNYAIRSNVNFKFTKTTEAIIRLYGQFDDYSGPVGGYDDNGNRINGGQVAFRRAIWSNPVMFPAVYPASYMPLAKHPLFGNALIPGTKSLYINPYASTISGYQQYKSSTMLAQVELKQDLSVIAQGLNIRGMAYTNRYSYFDLARQYNPFFYSPSTIDGKGIEKLIPLNDGSSTSIGAVGTEYLSYNEGNKVLNTTFYAEGAINYSRLFNSVHAVSGMVIGIMRSYQTANAGDLQASLPGRNMGVSGRFTYGYDNRYMMEFNFGYNGSERFSANNRFGLFPSVGVGYNISSERFFEPLTPVVSRLKLRATYGLVGNDQIGASSDRFFYMSNVNMNNSGYGAQFGQDYLYGRPGVSISRYANDQITWELSKQINLGADITLLRSLNIVIDAYRQNRSNILMPRSYVPTTMGLEAGVSANIGKVESKGVDISADFNKELGNKWWIQTRANFTYASNKMTVYDEPVWGDNLSYLYRAGHSIKQTFGYLAERLFNDDAEAANSPLQSFSSVQKVMGGDLKYHDMDKDGRITSNDVIPLGYPTTPEIVYGFGFSVGHGALDISAFFQGSARSSFFINPENISPFVINGGAQNGLLDVLAKNHWSEDNRNSYALWPRLSNFFVANNNQTSSWWLRNGKFLRLKTVEVGFNVPQHVLRKWGIGATRIYANGSNLYTFSSFKLWDVEMGGNGLGYPLQRVFNIGVNMAL
ncbi:TonB-linked outer membrane protein, SusC/RagA family [Filimonas lacunae]|uniref:TonB-linked outer membrane protein, SusC/RagA family n=1 Tax=Filimonas lacunae TaxID=477680 RepID=A0A173MP98_9BACT|nr:TonB-dependent receptor [Filimonas lacunae]BAV09464.1 TonB-dependent receptor [Filimonas lacunae]SIS73653.1 TonB-linked outer membrane protein, SusC/RagA family [Filimonas lacunae]